MGINFLETPFLVGGYYLFFGGVGLRLFFPMESVDYFKDSRLQFLLIFLCLILSIILVLSLRELIPLSEVRKNYLLELKLYFPLFEIPITISKFADIFFQQSLILSLVLFLKEKSNSRRVTVGLFTAIFFIIHLPLFYVFGWTALYFILPSLFAGIIFSTLMLVSTYGLLFSFLVHQLFYIALGIVMRLI